MNYIENVKKKREKRKTLDPVDKIRLQNMSSSPVSSWRELHKGR